MEAAVDGMYRRILADPTLTPFFKDMDMARLRRSQVAFMIMAMGGPHRYTGADLTRAHAGLVRSKGLSDRHFDAVARHLSDTLKELNVPATLIAEVMTLVGSTRAAVLGTAGG